MLLILFNFFSRGVYTQRTIFSFIVIISVRILLYIIYIISNIRQQHRIEMAGCFILLVRNPYPTLQGLTLLYTHIYKYTNRPYLPENNVCCPFFFTLQPSTSPSFPPAKRLRTHLYYYIYNILYYAPAI